MPEDTPPAEATVPAGPSEVEKRIESMVKRRILKKLEETFGCELPVDFEMLENVRNASRQSMINNALMFEMVKALFVEKFDEKELEAYAKNAEIIGSHNFGYYDVLTDALIEMFLMSEIGGEPDGKEKEGAVQAPATEVPTEEQPPEGPPRALPVEPAPGPSASPG